MICKKLTVLSFGGGQDSTTILQKIIHDPAFRAQHVSGHLVVVMSDTGDEHPKTYEHTKAMQLLCIEHNIDFFFLTPDMGFHYEKWRDLRSFYERTKTIGSKAFPKTCTDKLKIQPIYKFLEFWIGENYGFDVGRKKALYELAEKHGKIKVLLGIARGEERRASGNDCGPLWMQRTIEKVYPLIDEGMDRADCQAYLRDIGEVVPQPSNCMLCPYMSKVELLWLFRNHPTDFKEWVRLEAQKLEKHKEKGSKNLGVFGVKNLEVILQEAITEHGHMTDADLDEYKMSHGHCVKSKF